MKIADFPEDEMSMEDTIPSILQEVHDAMPFKRYIVGSGAMNMVSAVHWALHMPDVRPKFFSGDGTVNEEWATPLHNDIAGAANICVYAEDIPENMVSEKFEFLKQLLPNLKKDVLKEQNVACLWYVFMPDQYGGLKEYVQENKGDHVGDPIQKRKCILTVEDLYVLNHDYDITPLIFLQRVGDVVVIPANCAHQVLNINTCVKMAFDFVSPMSAHKHVENLKLVQQQPDREDYIGMHRVIFNGLVKATRILKSATSLQQTNLQLKKDNAELIKQKEQLEAELREIKSPTKINPRRLSTHTSSSVTPTATISISTTTTVAVDVAQVDTSNEINVDVDGDRTVYAPFTAVRSRDTGDATATIAVKMDKDVEVVGDPQDFTQYSNVRKRGETRHPRTKKKKKEVQYCQSCQLSFPSDVELRRHVNSIHGKEVLACYSCGRVFPSTRALTLHIQEKHKKQCPKCKKM